MKKDDIDALSICAGVLQELEQAASEHLLDPDIQENEAAIQYLRSIARRSGELARTVNACCYTLTFPKKKNSEG